jgi:hypothetical protein
MKKAALILGIILMVIVFVQSMLVGFGGTVFSDVALARGAFFGRIVALLFGVGAAFVLGRPIISVVIFAAGSLLGIIGGLVTGYYDLILWGVLSLGLGVLSYFAMHEPEVDRAPSEEEAVRTAGHF